MKNTKTAAIVQAAIIAALYAALTLGQNLLLPGSATMAVQFRLSEAMTMLCLFTPNAIWGLTLGCALANISSVAALGPWDLIFGTLASFIAAALIYKLRNLRLFGLPIVQALIPALVNGIIIGLELELLLVEGPFHFGSFLLQGSLVAIGELAVCIVLGLPFAKLLEKNKRVLRL